MERRHVVFFLKVATDKNKPARPNGRPANKLPFLLFQVMAAPLAGQTGQHQWRIGKRSKTNQTILLLDTEFLFSAGTADSLSSSSHLQTN